MSNAIELLGRAPIMRPIPKPDLPDWNPDDDWRGVDLIRTPKPEPEPEPVVMDFKQRRAKIKGLHEAGKDLFEICREMEMFTDTVRSDLRALGLMPAVVPKTQPKGCKRSAVSAMKAYCKAHGIDVPRMTGRAWLGTEAGRHRGDCYLAMQEASQLGATALGEIMGKRRADSVRKALNNARKRRDTK